MKNNATALIIGSGLGGLTCGAILSRCGVRVTVLEQMKTAGGALRMFKHRGNEFETGFHTVCGLDRYHTVGKLFGWLGIADRLVTANPDSDCFDEVIMDSRHYRLANGREGFRNSLKEYFPLQSDNIDSYVDDMWKMCEQVPIFNTKVMPDMSAMMENDTDESIGAFIDRHISDPLLRQLLGWNNMLYGGNRDRTPVLTAALITKLYVESATRFVDNSQQLVELLTEVIEQGGGEVITEAEVCKVEVSDRNVGGVVCTDSRRFEADWYIGAIHPAMVVKMLGEGVLSRAYTNRVSSLHNSCSMFSLFVKLRRGSFPYLNRNIYWVDHAEGIWQADLLDERFPRGFLIITPPTEDRQFAERLIVHVPMLWSDVARWSNTKVGNRGADYEQFKAECGQKVVDRVRELFPSFDEAVEDLFFATPLTLRDFLGLPEGAVCGTIHDCADQFSSHISTRTKLSNLLLTGQNVRLHGMCGVPITSIETAAWIVGLEKLMKMIDAEQTK